MLRALVLLLVLFASSAPPAHAVEATNDVSDDSRRAPVAILDDSQRRPLAEEPRPAPPGPPPPAGVRKRASVGFALIVAVEVVQLCPPRLLAAPYRIGLRDQRPSIRRLCRAPSLDGASPHA